MADIKDVEIRLKTLEDKLRENSVLLEKKLTEIDSRMSAKPAPLQAQQKTAKPAADEGEPVIIEGRERLSSLDDMRERIQELEDLLLLIELENTKLRDTMAAGGAGTGEPTAAPDIYERLNRMEEQLSSMRFEATPGVSKELEERIGDIERKVDRLAEVEERLEEIIESKVGKRTMDLHERLERIERAPKVVTRVEKTTRSGDDEETSILEEVQSILGKG